MAKSCTPVKYQAPEIAYLEEFRGSLVNLQQVTRDAYKTFHRIQNGTDLEGFPSLDDVIKYFEDKVNAAFSEVRGFLKKAHLSFILEPYVDAAQGLIDKYAQSLTDDLHELDKQHHVTDITTCISDVLDYVEDLPQKYYFKVKNAADSVVNRFEEFKKNLERKIDSYEDTFRNDLTEIEQCSGLRLVICGGKLAYHLTVAAIELPRDILNTIVEAEDMISSSIHDVESAARDIVSTYEGEGDRLRKQAEVCILAVAKAN